MSNTVFLVEFTARAWPRYFASGAAGASGTRLDGSAKVPVVGGITYKLTATVRRDATADGKFSAVVFFYDSAGALLGSLGAASSVTPGTSWTTYQITFGATGSAIPGGSVSMSAAFNINFTSTVGKHHIKTCAIENNAVPGVALNPGADMRSLEPWVLFAGTTPATVLTEIDATPVLLPLRYSTGPYITAAADTPPSTPYEARVLQPGLVRSELPAELAGPISSNFGEIVLSNADGALSDWPYMGLDGVQVSVLMGQATAARSTFVEVLRAAIDQATVDRSTARLRLRGPERVFNRPLATNRYAGNNALPAGLEGTADDLAGQPKPRLYGTVRNIAPPCVNTSRNIYQVNDPRTPMWGGGGDEIDVSVVRVRGAGLTQGATYANQADMEANAPSAGQYRVWPAGGCFRLGTAAAGLVTCDATRAVLAQERELGSVFETIVREMGVTTLRASTDTWMLMYGTPMNFATAGTSAGKGGMYVGAWVNDLRTAEDVLREITLGHGAWYGFVHWAGIPGSQFQMGLDVFPPALDGSTTWPTFDDASILSAQAIADPGPGRGVPMWRVDLGYSPNHTPISGDFDAGVSAADKAMLAAPGGRAQASAAVVVDMHPSAQEFKRDTVLTTAADATAEAERILEHLRRTRLWFEVRVPLAAVLAQTARPRLGSHIRLQWPGLAVLTTRPDLGGAVTPGVGTTLDYGYFTIAAMEMNLNDQTMRMTVRQAVEPAA